MPREFATAGRMSMNRSSTAVAVDYGPHEAAMQAYLREGEARAVALGNAVRSGSTPAARWIQPNASFHGIVGTPVRGHIGTMRAQRKTSGRDLRALAVLLAPILFLAGPPSVLAGVRDARAVMQRVYDQARRHHEQTSDVRLIIEDDEGRKRERHFRSFHRIFPDRTKTLVKFYKPANVRGTGLLSENLDGEDDTRQWIYLPALRSVKQLGVDDRHKSFMGSDFTNADISGRTVGQDEHEILEDEGDLVTVRSVPRDDRDPYAYLETQVMMEILVPRQIVFYDHEGRKLKTLRNEDIRRIDGMYVVTRSLMENHRTGGRSALVREDFDVRTRIDPHQVGFKGLRR